MVGSPYSFSPAFCSGKFAAKSHFNTCSTFIHSLRSTAASALAATSEKELIANCLRRQASSTVVSRSCNELRNKSSEVRSEFEYIVVSLSASDRAILGPSMCRLLNRGGTIHLILGQS